MAEPLDPKNADKRTAERYVRLGLLDEKAYEKHLKTLPDVADKADTISTVMLEEDVDDEGDDSDDTFSEDIPEV